MLRIGVDTGGTFTDFVVVQDGRVTTWKELSTPDDPSRAILEGIVRAVGEAGLLRGAEVIHGSTVATNALLEGRTARVAFVTNRGFEDLLEIGRQARPDLYDLDVRRPAPLAARDMRFGVAGRIRSDGTESEPMLAAELDLLASRLADMNVEAVALCLLHSYANPDHEERAAAALARAGLSVSVSSRLVPEHREYERASTTAVNAAVSPVVSRYLALLGDGLGPLRPASLRVMGSNGGALSPAAAGRDAARTVLSGPAGGVRAALHVARAIGRPQAISFDMGGTSTDVCLIPGEVRCTGDAVVAGYPVRIPSIDIHTVGAGGGSIAWKDPGGALRVGPQSAGAVPGPASYGKGGPATVTDANLVLGRIVPERFLDGRMPLDMEAARRAVGRLADGLGLGVAETAQGIVDVAEASMARAIRVISLHRGFEPADFDLLAFGGAGGLHAAALADTLGMRRAIVPSDPGVFSAFGMTVADVLKDRSMSLLIDAPAAGPSRLEEVFGRLEALCRRDLDEEGVAPDRMTFERMLDLRYRGQSYEINLPFEQGWLEAFHREHVRLYGYCRAEQPVEVVTLRVRGTGRTDPPPPRPAATQGSDLAAAREGSRSVTWRGQPAPAAVYDRTRLPAHVDLAGPAVVTEPGATTFVPPGWRAGVDAAGHLHLRRAEEP